MKKNAVVFSRKAYLAYVRALGMRENWSKLTPIEKKAWEAVSCAIEHEIIKGLLCALTGKAAQEQQQNQEPGP